MDGRVVECTRERVLRRAQKSANCGNCFNLIKNLKHLFSHIESLDNYISALYNLHSTMEVYNRDVVNYRGSDQTSKQWSNMPVIS